MSKYFIIIFKELFYILTASLIAFVFLEAVWPGVVLAYININWVLIFWLAIGIVVLASRNRDNSKQN